MKNFTNTILFSFLLLCAVPIFFSANDPVETVASIEDTVYEMYDEKTKKWSEVKLDRNPVANGGDENFWNIVNSQIVYPDRAWRARLEGDVVLTMTISEKGQLVELKVIQEVGGGCEEEAFNAIKVASTNRFVPAMMDGKPVKVRYNVSINFTVG